jgi:hypothetical protein
MIKDYWEGVKMKKKSIPELDKLFQEIGTYKKTTEFKELLDFVKKFPKIAPFNAMLLHIQKPGSNYVATAAEWQKKFGRRIKPEARPMVILRPFGPVTFVFDLSDTYGDNPFPKQLLDPFGVEGNISSVEFQRMINNLKCDGILYREADYGTNMAGMISNSAGGEELKIQKTTKEVWVKVLYNLIVNKNHEVETKFATVLHELAHLYCGHLGSPDLKWWDDRRGLNKNEREFEAECVCWLVCERKGISNPSAAYLNGYLDKNEYIPDISTDTVLKAVAIIESMINEKKNPRKEIITRTIDLKKGN